MNPKLSGNERVSTRFIDGLLGEIPVRIYRPADSGTYPVRVYFHGGGWVLGSLDGVDTIRRCITQKTESVVVSVSYHLAPEHKFPDPVREALL